MNFQIQISSELLKLNLPIIIKKYYLNLKVNQVQSIIAFSSYMMLLPSDMELYKNLRTMDITVPSMPGSSSYGEMMSWRNQVEAANQTRKILSERFNKYIIKSMTNAELDTRYVLSFKSGEVYCITLIFLKNSSRI